MDYEYINNEEYGLTVDEVNKVIQETDWDSFTEWYKNHQFPEGLQCVALHGFPSMNDYVIHLLEEQQMDTSNKELRLKMALLIDSMIH